MLAIRRDRIDGLLARHGRYTRRYATLLFATIG